MGDVQGTLRPLRNFSRKELRKLRVTRAVAARLTGKLVRFNCDLLNVFGVFSECQVCCSILAQRALGVL